MDPAPTVKLYTGAVIANFSSPHQFFFTSREILPACTEERSKTLNLVQSEIENQREKWKDIILSYSLDIGSPVWDELETLTKDKEIDIILVPYPVMQALKEFRLTSSYSYWDLLLKVRVCRVSDRVNKTIYPDKFCI